MFIKDYIIFNIYILLMYSPAKKQLSSPNLGLYGAQSGAINSANSVKREVKVGNKYPNNIKKR